MSHSSHFHRLINTVSHFKSWFSPGFHSIFFFLSTVWSGWTAKTNLIKKTELCTWTAASCHWVRLRDGCHTHFNMNALLPVPLCLDVKLSFYWAHQCFLNVFFFTHLLACGYRDTYLEAEWIPGLGRSQLRGNELVEISLANITAQNWSKSSKGVRWFAQRHTVRLSGFETRHLNPS